MLPLDEVIVIYEKQKILYLSLLNCVVIKGCLPKAKDPLFYLRLLCAHDQMTLASFRKVYVHKRAYMQHYSPDLA